MSSPLARYYAAFGFLPSTGEHTPGAIRRSKHYVIARIVALPPMANVVRGVSSAAPQYVFVCREPRRAWRSFPPFQLVLTIHVTREIRIMYYP